MNPIADRQADGSVSVSGVAGWSGYTFEDVEIALRNGRPALTGFRIRYSGEGDAPTLTGERLARVPAAKLAAAVASVPGGEYLAGDVTARLLQAFGALAEPTPLPSRPRGGSPEFHLAVLAVYQAARAEGRSGIAAIAAAARVKRDRAKQYSADAHRWAQAHAAEPERPAEGAPERDLTARRHDDTKGSS